MEDPPSFSAASICIYIILDYSERVLISCVVCTYIYVVVELIDVIGEVVLEAALALPRYEKHANLWKNVVKTRQFLKYAKV